MNFSVLSRNEALKRYNDALTLKLKVRNAEIQIIADLLACAVDDVIEYFSDDCENKDSTEADIRFEIPREYIISVFSEKQMALKFKARNLNKWQKKELNELTEEINRIDEYIKMFMLKDMINITKG